MDTNSESTTSIGTSEDPSSTPSMPGGASLPPASAGMATGNSGPAANELLNKVVQTAHQAIDRMAETAAPHVQRLQEGVSTAGEAFQSRADLARDTGEAWAESLRSTVRDNPLAAVATALALGMLITRLSRR